MTCRTIVSLVCLVILLALAPVSRAAEPSAHDPQFSNKQLWPGLTGKEAFVAQKWDKAPLLVWAHPGKGARERRWREGAIKAGRDAGLDGEAPENWLLDGKTPAAMPGPDQEVDVLIPASATAYMLAPPTLKVRHLTVEAGAAFASPAGVAQASLKSLSGNVWIKQGGRIDIHAIPAVGANHAFFRNDNRSDRAGSTRGAGTYVCYWMTIAKPKGSLEFLGENRLGDELKFNDGLTIVGPDSRLLPGAPSIQIIGAEAVLELQSGAFFGKSANQGAYPDILVQGELRAGSPERPLTKDATLGLNPKPAGTGIDLKLALSKANVARPNINQWKGNSLTEEPYYGKIAIPDGYGLAVGPSGKMRVHSADPAKARLRMTWNGVPATGWGMEKGQGKTFVNVYFFSDTVVLDGVVFDYFWKGGINMLNGDLRSKWKNVAFGEHNEGKPDELFTTLAAGETSAAAK